MKARIQSEGGEASWNRESPAAVGASAVQGEGSADGSTAETIKLDTERTTAPMPQFEDVSDTVYVKSSDGGSVRIRSACDTGMIPTFLHTPVPGQR